MKKFLCLLLSLVMVLSIFTACGEDKKPASDNDDGGDVAATENVLTVEKLAAVAKDSVTGSLTTASIKVVYEMKGASDEISPDTVATLKNYGWTTEKIEATLKLSALSQNEERGKLTMEILDGNGKKVYGLSFVVIKDDIYLESAAVTDLIDLISSLAPDMLSEDVKTTVNSTFEGKKYIMINIASLQSMYSGTAADDTEDTDMFYSFVGINEDEIKKLVEKISKEESLISAIKKAVEEVNLISSDKNSLTVKFNDESITSLIEKLTPVVKDNATFLGTAVFDAQKNSYIAEEDPDDEYYVDPKEVYTDDYKQEIIDGIAKFDEEDDSEDELVTDDDMTAAESEADSVDMDLNAEIKFTVDDNDSNFYSIAANITMEDKSEDGEKLAMTVDYAVVKSSETIADISASDCISFESVIIQLSSLFASSDDDMYNDEYITDEDYYGDSYAEDAAGLEF